jgi:DNA mismatch repair protein MutL
MILDIPAKKDIKQRLSIVFGQNDLEDFLPINFSDSYFTLSGYIGKPHIASRSNQKQFLFVNNRSVSDKLIALAVKESFGTLLHSSATPLFHLHITLPFEVVDVNVHPRKEQISFMNSRLIFDLVKQAISETLLRHNITYSLNTFDASITKGETTSFSASVLKETVLPWNRVDIGRAINKTPLLQIHQTYILAVTENGFVLVDQHAAHERILFEQFSKKFDKEKQKKHLYVLPKPVKISVSVAESQLVEEYSDVFENLGFSFEHFGTGTIIIRHIPQLFKGRKLEKIIKDMMIDLSEIQTVKKIDIASKRMLSFLSCRAAVKAGEILSQQEMETILTDLKKAGNNETCPHGRPTRIMLSLETLHKYFKRI